MRSNPRFCYFSRLFGKAAYAARHTGVFGIGSGRRRGYARRLVIAEVEFVLVEADLPVQDHFDRSAARQDGVWTPRNQHCDQTGGRSSCRSDRHTGSRMSGNAPDDPTRLTRAFSGRYARGLENRFMREMRGVEDDIPAYPIQNRLTQPLRAAAAKAENPDLMSLWAGQAVTLARPGEAGELVQRWWREAQETAQDLARRTKRSSPGAKPD